MDFYEAMKNRRSIYNISKEVTVSDEKIQEIVKYALKYTPTAFNSPSNKVVVLFENAHDQLWDKIKEALLKILPEDSTSQTEEKINSFKNGYGTVLYFEDTSAVESLQKQFALYADNFPVWSQQSSGMLQFAIWNLLESEGLGASLQHYNVFIEDFLKENWNVCKDWKLIAQMPFGKQTANPDEKQFNEIEDSLKIIK